MIKNGTKVIVLAIEDYPEEEGGKLWINNNIEKPWKKL